MKKAEIAGSKPNEKWISETKDKPAKYVLFPHC